MFQTQSFQAFNTFSLANITCSLKLNKTQSHLSHITLEYHIGLTDKYRLSIYQNQLSYDMKFVVNNLKGFYEYLKSLHENSHFRLCDFAKNKLTVTFLLKIFNQEQKIIKQEFQATLINDQVIWKSELKSKMDQLQMSLSKSISFEITKKVKDQFVQEKQMSLMKITALDKKVTRQLENINKKIQMVVNLFNDRSGSKPEINQRATRYRGRFQQQNFNLKKFKPQRNDTINSRLVNRQIEKTKFISKSFYQGKRRISANIDITNYHLNKNLSNSKEEKLQKRDFKLEVQNLQKQYQNVDSSKEKKPQKNKIISFDVESQPKIQTFFQKSQKATKNHKNRNQPFLIQKVVNRKNQTYHTPKKTAQKQISEVLQISSQYSKDPHMQSLQKHAQMADKLKEDNRSKKVNDKNSMIDQKDQFPLRNDSKKGAQNEEKSENSNHFRSKFFQKNLKKTQTIDLENEEEMQRFKIRIFSGKEDNQTETEKVKEQEAKQILYKSDSLVIERSNISQHSSTNKQNKKVINRTSKQNLNFIDQIMNQDSHQSNLIVPQRDQQDSSSQEIKKMTRIVQSYKRNKLEDKMVSNPQNISSLKTPLKISESGFKNQNNTLNELIDPSKQVDYSTINPASLPSYGFLQNASHIIPIFYPKGGNTKMVKYNLKDYFSFDSAHKKIQKVSTFARSAKHYISIIGMQPLPSKGRYYMAFRILKSQNYHICIGIVDMPSQIKVNEIPKNCDAIYVLDGGLHDQKGGSARQNGWRVKEGKPVDVLKMELLVEKGEFYVITIVDMDKEEIQFYYNEEFISKTHFSSFCSRNKKRIHPYVALKSQKDCIEIV